MEQELQAKVAHYKPDMKKLKVLHETPLLLLVGISGAGKDTVVDRLLAKPDYYRMISHTTRSLRENHGVMERDGVEYHFIDKATADRMLDAHEFIETNYYSNNVYGTSVAEVVHAHEHGKIVLNDVDVHGADNFVRLTDTAKAVFVLPPSYEEWWRRLSARYGDGEAAHAADIQRRIAIAHDELRHVLASEHFYLMINDDLDRIVAAIDALAHGAVFERRPAEAVAVIEDILKHSPTAL